MKAYKYGYKLYYMALHDSTKLVKSSFIQNQKPLFVLKELLYNEIIFNLVNM